MNSVYNEYGHDGWTGVPGQSSFIAEWGEVPAQEICDCSDFKKVGAAGKYASTHGFRYFFISKKSSRGSNLYRVRCRDLYVCVNAYSFHLKQSADNVRAKFRNSLEFRIRQILRGAATRAKKRGIPFDLTVADIMARVEKGVCEATGVSLDLGEGEAYDPRNPFTPSLDQKVPGAGYTKDNVQVVALCWNLMKADFDHGAFQKFLNALYERRPGCCSLTIH